MTEKNKVKVNISETEKLVETALVDTLVMHQNFGQLLLKIGVKVVESEIPACAWTDGTGIFVNHTQIQKNNEEGMKEVEYQDYKGRTIRKKVDLTIQKREMQFILCHELMHLVGLTYERGETIGLARDPVTKVQKRFAELWNMATDYEINAVLQGNIERIDNSERRKPIGNMPDWVLYEEDFDNKSAEEIMKILLEQDKNKNGKDDDSDGEGNKGKGSSLEQALGFGLDVHLPMKDDATRNSVIGKMSEVFGSRQNGISNSAFDRMLDVAFKPEPFNWRKALAKYIRSYIKDNYSWNKPSRAGIANKIILPSTYKTPKMRIGVAIDTSGSIYDTELKAMMNHLFTILKQFKDFEIDVWCCGSKVYTETLRTYTGRNKNEITSFEFQSDGGNDMRENFKFIKDRYTNDKLDCLIIMSDFYDPLDGDTTTTSICPVIYLCIDHDKFVPPKLIKGEVYPFTVEKGKNY